MKKFMLPAIFAGVLVMGLSLIVPAMANSCCPGACCDSGAPCCAD